MASTLLPETPPPKGLMTLVPLDHESKDLPLSPWHLHGEHRGIWDRRSALTRGSRPPLDGVRVRADGHGLRPGLCDRRTAPDRPVPARPPQTAPDLGRGEFRRG